MTEPKATVAMSWTHTPAEWRAPEKAAPKPGADAPRILKLPTVHHAQLGPLTQQLAANGSTFDQAVDAISREADRLGVNALDLEMCQPGSACRVPFAVSALPSPGGEFQANVAGHVRALLEDKR